MRVSTNEKRSVYRPRTFLRSSFIVNTDQGSQFTGSEFIDTPKAHPIAVSMDGKECWRDNVFLERFWKMLT